MNHQEKLLLFKNAQEIIVREFGRRIERGDLLSMTSMLRVAVDCLFFLSNTDVLPAPTDKNVADLHETLHAGLDSIYAVRKLGQSFPRKNGKRELAWRDFGDFTQFKADFQCVFEKLADVNIGAEARLDCLLDLARMELIFLGLTLY